MATPKIQTILIMDDDPALRETVGVTLSEAGYRALAAASAQVALEVLRSERVDLLLLDLSLPGGGGLDFLQHVEGTPEWAAPPVLVVSGAPEAELRKTVTVTAGYLPKPFDTDQLLASVQEILGEAERLGFGQSEQTDG